MVAVVSVEDLLLLQAVHASARGRNQARKRRDFIEKNDFTKWEGEINVWQPLALVPDAE